MTGTIKTDLLVIGAGSGGLSVAAGAVQMGARVVLLEGHRMGGDCLNFGCVPSKALLAAAAHAHASREGTRFGVTTTAPQIDYAAAQAHVAATIAHIAPVDSQERFEALGVHVIRDYGRFSGPNTVMAGETEITARRIVIATGSSPAIPPIPGLAETPYLTNETLFDLREKPDHLLILGGGPIGLEMAQAHAHLGCRVTVLEAAEALGREDPEARALVLETLRAEGVDLYENTPVTKAEGKPGAITLTAVNGAQFSGTHLLVATGRKPNIDRLNLAAAGIAYSPKGITTDNRLRTTNRRIYAIGDVAGGAQFTHLAGYHAGLIIREVLFSLPAHASMAHIPRATYTSPELAQIGLTEAQARAQHGAKLEISRFDLEHNDRAIAQNIARGFIKVMVVKGRPVGVTIVGPQAGENIALWSLAIAQKLKLSAIAGLVAPYPTLAEMSKRAAGAYFSPRLFDNPWIKRVVRAVQRFLP